MDNNWARKTRRQNKVNKVHKNFRNDKQKTKYKKQKYKKKKSVMQQADRLSLSPLWAPEWNYKQFFIYCVLKFRLLSNVLQIGRATFVSYSHSLDNSVAFSVVVFFISSHFPYQGLSMFRFGLIFAHKQVPALKSRSSWKRHQGERLE